MIEMYIASGRGVAGRGEGAVVSWSSAAPDTASLLFAVAGVWAVGLVLSFSRSIRMGSDILRLHPVARKMIVVYIKRPRDQ